MKIFVSDFEKKTDPSLFNKIRAFKRERLERDVIQMDTENLGSEDERDPIIGDAKKLK